MNIFINFAFFFTHMNVCMLILIFSKKTKIVDCGLKSWILNSMLVTGIQKALLLTCFFWLSLLLLLLIFDINNDFRIAYCYTIFFTTNILFLIISDGNIMRKTTDNKYNN